MNIEKKKRKWRERGGGEKKRGGVRKIKRADTARGKRGYPEKEKVGRLGETSRMVLVWERGEISVFAAGTRTLDSVL